MATLNPYASHLGNRDPRLVLATTAQELTRLAASLSASQLEYRPAPGKWSVREILCHLADCELVFAFRLRQTLAEPHHNIQPFDQEAWAQRYAGCDAQTALALFTGARAWNLALLPSVAPEEWGKPVTHPERGAMTFATILETMAGHDINHLGQVEAIAQAVPA